MRQRTSPKLFEANRSHDAKRLNYSEPSYRYLAASAQPEAEIIRQLLEDWLLHYPMPLHNDIVSRFRSARDEQHKAATFELYLFTLLRKLGYNIEVGPYLGVERPDFLARENDGVAFILEATSVTEASDKETSGIRRRERILDQLYSLRSNRFLVDVSYDGAPTSDVNIKRELACIERWLDTLTDEQPTTAPGSTHLAEAPTYTFAVEGLSIELTAISAREAGLQPSSDHIIMSIGAKEARFSITSEAIRKKIENKMKHYERANHPFVLAINSSNFAISQHEVFSALFGDLAVQVPMGARRERAPTIVRIPNGVLYQMGQPRWTRLSALLIIGDLHPWSIGARKLTLFENPHAARKLRGPITVLQRVTINNDGNSVLHEGRQPWEILGLWQGWPRGDS